MRQLRFWGLVAVWFPGAASWLWLHPAFVPAPRRRRPFYARTSRFYAASCRPDSYKKAALPALTH